jgi:uncharacterized membrane-anchored protein
MKTLPHAPSGLRSALVLGALLFGAPALAFATEPPGADMPAAPADEAEAPPPGWDKLSPEVQEKLAALDPTALQALGAKIDRGEKLSADEQQLADALILLTVSEFDAKINYRSGDIKIGDGLAVLHLGTDYRFLDPADAQTVIEKAWNNPPGERPLGMIVPAKLSPAHPDGWGVILSYTEDGHVDDADAESIDYDELLTSMKAGTEEENETRKQLGFPAIHLVGWAEPPHYDKARHSLYWARELSGDDQGEHSLNYAVRVLGRKGVLELNAVSGMSQLPDIKPEMEKVYALVEFEQGNRYTDFDPDIDSLAVYGIGGLIAGKAAAKVGLFALILKGLIAAKKAVIIGVIALIAGLKAFFSRKKSE